MSNQEPQNESNTKENAVVDKRRRFIKGAGIAAPVALTLTSPSVFGALCLSQIMSGNESHTGQGSCALGHSPAYWSNPLNFSSWPAGFTHHTSGDACSTTVGPPPTTVYSGGTAFNAAIAFSGDPVSTAMAAILCAGLTSTLANFVAAILNAQTPGYILTPAQVVGLRNGSIPVPPGYGTVDAFLTSTWT